MPRSKKKTVASTKKAAKISNHFHTKKKLHNNAPALFSLIRQALKKIPTLAQSVILMAVSIFFLAVIAIFLQNKFFRPQSIAEFLPSNATVALLDINIDKNTKQVKNFLQLLHKHPIYQPENLISLIGTVLPADYMNNFSPWLGRSIGVALIKPPASHESLKTVFLVETKSSQKTLEFIKEHMLTAGGDEIVRESYKNFDIAGFKSGQNFHFLFIKNYLMLSESADILKQIIDNQSNVSDKLTNNTVYQKIINNLPRGALMSGYFNIDKLFEYAMKNSYLQNLKTKDILALRPFIKIFQADGFVISSNDRNFNIQRFTSIDRGALNNLNYLTYSDQYKAKLLKFSNENPSLLVGGHNLYKEIQRVQEIFTASAKVPNIIFDGLLEAQKQKYFGKEISLRTDVYPLLKNEYLLAIEEGVNEGNQIATLFLELDKVDNDVSRFEKIVNAFVKTEAIFSPRVHEIILPDGTKGEEIIASSETITKTTLNYENFNITTLQPGNLKWNINYAVIDKILIISNDLGKIKIAIDDKNQKSTVGFTTNKYFQKSIKPLLWSADEFFHFKVDALLKMLGWNENSLIKAYTEPFKNVSATKNFFDDGISTIYLVDIN